MTLPLIAALLWIAPAAQKIRPATQPAASAATSAKIAGAKNEFEAFQVVITGAATGISMSTEGLSDGNGHVISGRELVLYREALINVTQQTGGDGAAGMWPDALVPDVDPIMGEKRNAFPFDVPAGESRAVLVDVHAPAAFPGGTYTGVLHVTGGITQDVPVSYTVWDFDVPSTSTLKSAFGMAWNGPCIGHGDSGCNGGVADLKLRARYVQAALDNHVSLYAPYYTATINADGSGNWADFDQYTGPYMDGTADMRLQGAKLTAVQVNGPSTTPVVAGWSKHFAAKGWSDRLFDYVCDEPPLTCQWPDITSRVAAARSADAAVPTLVTTTTDEAQKQGVSGIDLFVPVVNFMEGKPGTQFAGNQRSKYPAVAWWYQSCMSFGCSGVGGGLDGTGESGWPSYAIDTDGTRNRAMEWMSFSYNMQGELYYETTQAFFGGDPWTDQYRFGGTGDGTLFYPGTVARIGGTTEIPVESLRLKGIRDGMEDYELLALAKKLGVGDQALAIAQGVFPKTYLATSTPAAIDSARAELAALILHALGKDVGGGGSGTGSGSGTGGTGTAGTGGTGTAGTGGTGTTGTGGTGTGTGTTGTGTGTGTGTTGTGTSGGTTTCVTTACNATDSGTTNTDAAAVAKSGLGALGFPTGGCSSSGVQSAWLAIPLLGLMAFRRRRSLSKVRR